MIPAIPLIEQKWIVVKSKRKKDREDRSEQRYFVSNVPAFDATQKSHGYKTHAACLKTYRWWLKQNEITPQYVEVSTTLTKKQKEQINLSYRETTFNHFFK